MPIAMKMPPVMRRTPPFELCELVKGFRNGLSAKGHKNGEQKNRQSGAEAVQSGQRKP